MNKLCNACKGKTHVTMQVKNLGTLNWNLAIVVCPQCDGKGHTNESDSKRVQSVEQYNQIVG